MYNAPPATSWAQPSALPASLPWQPRIPASSNCVTYSSQQLFGTVSASVSISAASNLIFNLNIFMQASVTRTTIGAGASTTKGSSSTGTAASTNSAERLRSWGLLAFLGVIVVILFASDLYY